MKKIRIIPRLDIKGPNVVKGIQLEGLRVIGNPAELAKKYYDQGADEILYIDIVASLYERSNLLDVVEKTVSKGVFIPITVGGGIRTLDDIKNILRAGADKVAINTAATRNPEFITKAAKMFGSQCIVGAVEAKKKSEGKWEAYIDNGRECTGLDAVEWAKKMVDLGAGELLITSVDRDGTEWGYDIELLEKINSQVSVPVIACGGAKNEEGILECIKKTRCDGIAFGSILHYNKTTIQKVKEKLTKNKIKIRQAPKGENIKADKANKKKVVSIIDYNVGNIKSVVSAFGSVGNTVRLVKTPKDILTSELLVLPGDGAFGYAMEQLKSMKLIKPLKEYVKMKRPLLGICLGMQLLMTESEEFGHHLGLNMINGKVLSFDSIQKVKEKNYRIPHMGWNQLRKPNQSDWKKTILSDIPESSEVYFVHSFKIILDNEKDYLAKTVYGNQEFCSVLQKDNIYGTQFHPEKSGQVGMKIIAYFSNL